MSYSRNITSMTGPTLNSTPQMPAPDPIFNNLPSSRRAGRVAMQQTAGYDPVKMQRLFNRDVNPIPLGFKRAKTKKIKAFKAAPAVPLE